MARQGLKDIAYDYLWSAIMSYDLAPGHVLVEQDLSDQLGISRTPVREALKQLELEGLVRHVPSRGTFVEDINVQDVEEIFQIRILFETTALEQAILDVTDREIDEVEKKLTILNDTRIDEHATREQYYGSDRDLHYLIMKYSRNSRMISFHKTMESQLERLRRISSMTPMRLAKSRQEHLAIIEALRARDLERAKKVLTAHLCNVRESTLNVCKTVRLDRM